MVMVSPQFKKFFSPKDNVIVKKVKKAIKSFKKKRVPVI